ncbi:class I SAM-dependent methyltransferase [Cellulomonas sp. NPDC057328]|uniref:class I SAM-dependent methyltransferase n=1 Tax=Cellulomonas sp. NPDC057328 TaxID=3346101 RepID=UPI00363D3C36
MDQPIWRSHEALGLPFDQYQRYATAARVVDALGGSHGRTMLDVGGGPGFLELFFPGAQVAVVDRYGTHEGNFVVADGAQLPFADASFDIVLTLDTLEHIPAQYREAFLAECHRVARDYVVLSAPHATEGVELAEQALQAFVTARFGEVFGTLQEHIDNGLPRIEETVAALAADDWAVGVLPSGYLPRWLLGMMFHHEMLASGMPELDAVNRFYNERQSLSDNAAPSYRHVVVASRTRSLEELTRVVDDLRSPAQSADAAGTLAAIGGAVLASRLGAAGVAASQQAELARLREELATTRAVVADREAHLVAARDRIVVLEDHVAQLRDSLPRQAWRAVTRRGSKQDESLEDA